MAKFLFHLGRWSFTRKWLAIGIWLVVLVGIGAAALTGQKGFNDVFEIDDMPSTHATELLQEKFPEMGNPGEESIVNVVFQAPEGKQLKDPEYMAAMDRTVEAIKKDVSHLGDTLQLHNPVTMNDGLQKELVKQEMDMGLPRETALLDAHTLRAVSDDGRTGVLSFTFDVPVPADVTDEDRAAVTEAMNISRDAGLTVEAGGLGFADPVAVEPISEIAGLVVAMIILWVTFASLLAAGLPLLTAVVGIGIGTLLTVGATFFVPLNSMTPTLGLMLGLAVGIDYALFIMARYRDELRHGRSRLDAIGLATGTAGSAVVFAGLTVIIALVSLRLANITFLTYMGYAAAANVFIAVLVALTLLPALLGVLGDRVFKKEAAGPHDTEARAVPPEKQKNTFSVRWVKLVHRVPGLMLALVMVVLAGLSIPVLNLELALPSDKTANVTSTQRKSAEMLEEGFGGGKNAPMLVVVDGSEARGDAEALKPYRGGTEPTSENQPSPAQATFMYAADQMRQNADVVNAQIVGMSEDETAAQLLVTPKAGPTDDRTVQLIHTLRAQQAEIEAATGATIGITGLTAIQQDVTDKLADAMPIYLGLVVGLALILLLMVFRSIVVTLIAALGFLLSVGAAFGVTVLFWQEGLWDLWHSPGPLVSFVPIFLIGVTFGLAMDYQVFIVSRMRERFLHDSQAAARGSRYTAVEDSVIGGFSLGAQVVTAAALIMIGVFASFVFQPLPFIQIFGFALGAGVLFDAFFIRMTFVPALMFLFGKGTWWMPKWLDKVLPTVDVEGSALEKAFASGEIGEAAKR